MALGAGTSNLPRLVLSHGLALTVCGLALGKAAAWGSARLLGSLLYSLVRGNLWVTDTVEWCRDGRLA